MQDSERQCKIVQYSAEYLTADGAYHCPVGSIWLFLLGKNQAHFHDGFKGSSFLHSFESETSNECSGLTWCIFYQSLFLVFAFVCVFASLLHSFALESLHAIWPNTVVNGFLPPPKTSKDADYWTP